MTWYAKPSGPYAYSSPENAANSIEIFNILSGQGFTVEAIAGVCANSQHESGLNPWRWQNDTVSPTYSNGYGLLQWTPAYGYLDLSGTTPNMSVTAQTQGATPEDGARQMQAFYEDNPAKWHSSCWRSYWDTTTYSEYYAKTRYILNTWGNGTKITLDQFKTINDASYAADCFLACFEGPGTPDYLQREATAAQFYERFTGVTPDPPTPPPDPTPPPVVTDSIYWFLKRQADKMNTSLIMK